MVHVASANCGFLLGIFFSSFVNAFHLRDSILNDFCFFKDGASNWNNRNIYVLQNTHTHIKRHYTQSLFYTLVVFLKKQA
jgi:hypothetical protein